MKITDKFLDQAIFLASLAMVIYHLLSTQWLLFGPVLHLNTHLIFSFGITFLLLMRGGGKWRIFWTLCLIISVVVFGYVYAFVYDLEQRSLFNTLPDLIVGAAMIVIAIVGTWQALGATLAVFTAICVLYFAVCSHLPGFLSGPAYPLYRLIPTLTIGLHEGLYGIATSTSAQMIFLFMVFGGLLQASGVIAVFFEIGKVFSRKLRSGSAQTTIVGGGLAGTITGAASCDAMIVGSFSIPFMKNAGYSPEAAGAIMAVSSTGAQIMPPVLGAAAFGLAAYTGIPYARIMVASIIPAILYFGFFGLAVHWYTLKNLKVERIKESVDWRLLGTVAPAFFVPLGTLILFLVNGFSPQLSVGAAIVCILIVSSFRKETRFTLSTLRKGIIEGAKGGAQIGVCSAAIGFIIIALTETGFANRLPLMVEAWSGGSLLVASLWIFLICYLLGCGMPTLTIYFTVATVAAPSLINLGAQIFSAHLFVMWAGVFSYLTPPVAIASMVCAKMAGAPFIKTGILACRLAFATYFIPFLILAAPVLTFQESSLSIGMLHLAGSCGLMFAAVLLTERYWFSGMGIWETVMSLTALVLFSLFLFGAQGWAFIAAWLPLLGVTCMQLRKRARGGVESAVAIS